MKEILMSILYNISALDYKSIKQHMDFYFKF